MDQNFNNNQNNFNNHPINNQNFNQNIDVNSQPQSFNQMNTQPMNNGFQQQNVEQTIQPQHISQQSVQEHSAQPVNVFYNDDNHNLNSKSSKKKNTVLIIGVVAALLIIAVFLILFLNNSSKNDNDNKNTIAPLELKTYSNSKSNNSIAITFNATTNGYYAINIKENNIGTKLILSNKTFKNDYISILQYYRTSFTDGNVKISKLWNYNTITIGTGYSKLPEDSEFIDYEIIQNDTI